MDSITVKTILNDVVNSRYEEFYNSECSEKIKKLTGDNEELYSVIYNELKDKFNIGFKEGVLFMSQIDNKIK